MKYAQKYDIPDKLITSIIKNESSFKPGVVSKTGNKGLMQVSDELLKDSKISDWKNIDNNILVGTKYLNYLFDKFDNDLEKSIAAYNAGDGRVSRLVKTYGTKWKDHLPAETKAYLPKVLKDYYN